MLADLLGTETNDILHFFVYDTYKLITYNISSNTYRAHEISLRIPANFMSVETADGRIFLTGGGDGRKAYKTCHEFSEE